MIYNLNAPIGNINREELLFSLGSNCWHNVLFLEKLQLNKLSFHIDLTLPEF